MGLISIIRKYKLKSHSLRVLMLGLDNSGKTSISYALLNKELDEITPTMGFNIESILLDDYNVDIWDIGGQLTLRKFWNNYFDSTDCLIWVIDVADIERLSESWKELETVLRCQGIRGASLLIWVNKIDLMDEGNEYSIISQVTKGLRLDQLNNEYSVICCSAFTKRGLKEGMSWILNSYKRKYNIGQEKMK